MCATRAVIRCCLIGVCIEVVVRPRDEIHTRLQSTANQLRHNTELSTDVSRWIGARRCTCFVVGLLHNSRIDICAARHATHERDLTTYRCIRLCATWHFIIAAASIDESIKLVGIAEGNPHGTCCAEHAKRYRCADLDCKWVRWKFRWILWRNRLQVASDPPCRSEHIRICRCQPDVGAAEVRAIRIRICHALNHRQVTGIKRVAESA